MLKYKFYICCAHIIALGLAAQTYETQSSPIVIKKQNEMVVSKPSTLKAIGLSILMPGAGELYLKKGKRSYWAAGLFMVAETATWITYFSYRNAGLKKEKEYIRYADKNWNVDEYLRFLETTLQLSDGYLGRKSSGIDKDKLEVAENEWGSLSGISVHHLYKSGRQQYYEMIYKYPEQFGQGWSDANWDLVDIPNRSTGYTPYNLTDRMKYYRSMRVKSNAWLENARNATGYMLANRVLSVLDIVWITKKYKASNSTESVQMGIRIKPVKDLNLRLKAYPSLEVTF
ncbi:MAG TPA: hypothetical protein PLH27_03425 [bacterium]|nr:hypothetical protein [bacterium]HNB08462.1 hypothetical protein [bacterium]HNB55497.1 hypothetical protein [bacterium]HNC48013.1 hypothetical protein [bacterium]HND78519.1 hypothetical protein [bacterium]